MTEPVPGDEAGTVVDEHVVLAKFEGSPTQEEIDSGEADLLEKIVIHNGEVVETWTKE
jgi:hypothetical protein